MLNQFAGTAYFKLLLETTYINSRNRDVVISICLWNQLRKSNKCIFYGYSIMYLYKVDEYDEEYYLIGY